MAFVKCSQCDRQAVAGVTEGQIPLCVDHHFTFTKTSYLQAVMVASHLNYTEQQLYVSTGGLLPLTQYNLPQPTFLGEAPVFNSIRIDKSAIGVLNTGTISNLKDVEFTVELMNSQGQEEVAHSIAELTEAVINNGNVSIECKEEISEQLRFIASQVNVKQDERQPGVAKAVLSGIRTNIATIAALVTIFDKVEPVIRRYLGM